MCYNFVRQKELGINRDEMNKLLGKTEEELDRIADAFENDEVDFSEFTVVKRGRPTLFSESMESITIRVPKSVIVKIEQRAEQKGFTKSEYIRELIRDDLAKPNWN